MCVLHLIYQRVIYQPLVVQVAVVAAVIVVVEQGCSAGLAVVKRAAAEVELVPKPLE